MHNSNKLANCCSTTSRYNITVMSHTTLGVVVILLLIQGYGVTSSVLKVSITVTYTPPSTFNHPAPYYRAASPLSLTCEAEDIVGTNFYSWTSSCTGNCFTMGQTSKTVSTNYLESSDSGVHTCTVYRVNEEVDSANVTIDVVGAGIYVSHGHDALPNNGIILTGAGGRIGEFRCISGSSRSNVGHLFDTNEVDITTSSSDPFFTFRHNPGTIHVRSLRSLHSNEQGIYTCRIPDETGTTVNFNVGLYLSTNDLLLTISKTDYSANGDGTYTITCTSTGAPPTDVVWTKSELDVTNSDIYIPSQRIIDRASSTYDNQLTIIGSYQDAVGDYSCNISNSISYISAQQSINALEVTGYENPIVVGLLGTLRCSTILNVTSINWYLTATDSILESSSSPIVEYDLTPNSVGLDGTRFTCKAETVNGDIYSKTIAIEVKELNNSVTIQGPSNPLLAGSSYTFTCTATAEVATEVRWTNSSGNSVEDGEELSISGPFVFEDTTTLMLTFSYLRTSQAGTYSCLSITDTPTSVQRAVRDVIVRIPSPTVKVVSHPNTTQLFTTQQLNITCHTIVHPAVDTATNVVNTWSGPSGLMSSSRHTTVVGVTGTNLEFNSSVQFSSLRSSDSGRYTCISNISLASFNIVSSNSISASIVVSASLKTTIDIDYTPPDQYPDYAPPNYRAASSVTLHCRTEGASGSVSYRWSSTCSSCFASSSSSSSITEYILKSRDRGYHTCTATDSNGNTGSDRIQMNIVGAGIYVSRTQRYAGRQASQPNNTYLSIYSGSRSSAGNSCTRFNIYCCSNRSSYNYVGSIMEPFGSTYTSNFHDLRIERYSSSSTYAGCIRFYGYKTSSYTLSYNPGVYMCNIPDSSGQTQRVNFALFSYNTQSVPTIYRFQRTQVSNSIFTLICETRTAPPTEITWQRNGVNLTVDGSIIQMTQTVTDRYNLNFTSTLTISDNADNIVGTYRVIVGNSFGQTTSNTISLRGITVTSSAVIGTVGSSITFSCSSDLNPTRIEWYKNDSLLSQRHSTSGSITLGLISTDDEGTVYTCSAVGGYASQERNKILEVKVPDNWATIEVTNVTQGDAVHQHSYSLMCTVQAIQGMNITPWVYWYDSDGSIIETGGRFKVDTMNNNGSTTTLSLTFYPVLHDDSGVYSCRALVIVPWMTTQPPVKQASINMDVITQAMFQLRMGPLSHCSTWEVSKAIDLETWIKKDIEQALQERCSCNFNSSVINSGEFSCRTTTTEVIYRAIISGSSESRTATELISYLEDWLLSEGTLLYNKFRLQLAQNCSLHIKSFSEPECEDDGDQGYGESRVDEGRDLKDGGLLLGSSTCYRFQSCGHNDQGMNDNTKDSIIGSADFPDSE